MNGIAGTLRGAWLEILDMHGKVRLPVASLCLYGVFDARAISTTLSLEPDYVQTKGETFVSPSGKERVAQAGLWMLHSDRFCSSSDVTEHVRLLVDALPDVDLASISGIESAKLALAVLSSEQPEVVRLPRALIERLGNLGLSLAVEVY